MILFNTLIPVSNTATESGFDPFSLLPIICIFVIFYFLLIRPQQRKMREHQRILSELRRGDRIVTNGGLIGTIVKITDEKEIQLEIAENVRVRVLRSMISDVFSKSDPAARSEKKD